MKVTKFSSSQLVTLYWNRYSIDWERKVSAPQKRVKDFLRRFWAYDKVCEELLIPGSKKRLDIVNISKMIVVEVSPDSVHSSFNKFFHDSRSGLMLKKKADNDKEDWCLRNGFQYASLRDSDIKNLSKDLLMEQFSIAL